MATGSDAAMHASRPKPFSCSFVVPCVTVQQMSGKPLVVGLGQVAVQQVAKGPKVHQAIASGPQKYFFIFQYAGTLPFVGTTKWWVLVICHPL